LPASFWLPLPCLPAGSSVSGVGAFAPGSDMPWLLLRMRARRLHSSQNKKLRAHCPQPYQLVVPACNDSAKNRSWWTGVKDTLREF
jgi:hypothetical protein